MIIIVKKLNCRKTEIIKQEQDTYYINVKGKAENNKANIEIIKFFSKYFGKPIEIISGYKNKRKLLRFKV
ncbi:MAG: DUF167 domain-containing protein [Candidatus Woesearchaeota archaeon]|nr:DUF167 domain-containing protein [Candidatus Woesearchaeota archaeon]